MVVSPTLIRIAVMIAIRLEYKDDLTTGLHPFRLGQHMTAARKVLCAPSKNYNLVAGRTGTIVVDTVKTSISDSVKLPTTLSMTRLILSRTCLVLINFLI